MPEILRASVRHTPMDFRGFLRPTFSYIALEDAAPFVNLTCCHPRPVNGYGKRKG